MRSIWFALFDTTIEEVDQHLSASGLGEPNEGDGYRWYYPPGPNAILYIDVGAYEWVEKYDLRDEYDELLEAVGNRKPAVEISVDVTGRSPGDEEVNFIVDTILRRFEGFAFDDFISYSHAWTLIEIESNKKIDGLRFFDYKGYHEKNKKRDA